MFIATAIGVIPRVRALLSPLLNTVAMIPPLAVLPWPEIVARVIESDDDHAIKIVDGCRELEKSCGGAVWSVAASRAVA